MALLSSQSSSRAHGPRGLFTKKPNLNIPTQEVGAFPLWSLVEAAKEAG